MPVCTVLFMRGWWFHVGLGVDSICRVASVVSFVGGFHFSRLFIFFTAIRVFRASCLSWRRNVEEQVRSFSVAFYLSSNLTYFSTFEVSKGRIEDDKSPISLPRAVMNTSELVSFPLPLLPFLIAVIRVVIVAQYRSITLPRFGQNRSSRSHSISKSIAVELNATVDTDNKEVI